MTATIDYNAIAGTYRRTRAAVPWVVETIAPLIAARPAGAVVIELGCGTGNHVRTLAELLPAYQYEGFDQSEGMLREAQQIPSKVIFRQGDAQLYWPYSDADADLVFCVDVIHYIRDLAAFFLEARRVLKPDGALLIATDSEADLRERSLTQFFPEILVHEQARYHADGVITNAAIQAGLHAESPRQIRGERPITTDDLHNLAAQCSSALRLISAEALTAGVERVRQAQAAGESWRSCYTIYLYTRP
jgi:SAM-dependent methyltransferase